VVLYELLTGELPKKKLQPPSRKVQIDVHLDEIVLKALAEKPELRFRTADDLRIAVEEISLFTKSQLSEADSTANSRSRSNGKANHHELTARLGNSDPKKGSEVRSLFRRPIREVVALIVLILALAATIVAIQFRFLGVRNGSSTAEATNPGGTKDTIIPKMNGTWSLATFSVNTPDGVYQTSDNSWSIKGGRAFLQIRRESDGSLGLRCVYPFHDLLPKETITLFRIRWSLPQVQKLARSLHIAEEQMEKLEAVTPATDILVESEDLRRLNLLFEKYMAASNKSLPKKALVEAVAGIDKHYFEQTMDRIRTIGLEIQNVFREDQLANLSSHFGPAHSSRNP
jgi:hypothetical protein